MAKWVRIGQRAEVATLVAGVPTASPTGPANAPRFSVLAPSIDYKALYMGDAPLRSFVGQVVRGYRFSFRAFTGYLSSPTSVRRAAIRNANVAYIPLLLGKGLAPQAYSAPPDLVDGQPSSDPAWQRVSADAASMVPLAVEYSGAVPLALIGPGVIDPTAEDFAGLVAGFTGHADSFPGVRPFDFSAGYSLEFYVDGRPRWERVNAPTSVGRTQVSGTLLNFRFQWPGTSDFVVGANVRITSTNNRVMFAPEVGGAFTHDLTVPTSADGQIRVRVFGANSGADTITLDTDQGEVYSPPLPTTLPISVFEPNVVVGGEQCVVLPAVTGVTGVPAHIDASNVYAWNAGANSTLTLPGNVQLTFPMDKKIGATIGFTPDPDAVPNRARITHGFYFSQSAAGFPLVAVIEAGAVVRQPVIYAEGQAFTLRRVGTLVTYLIGTAKVYVSRAPSVGTLHVANTLYATGDSLDSSTGTPGVCFWEDLIGVSQECGGGGGGGFTTYEWTAVSDNSTLRISRVPDPVFQPPAGVPLRPGIQDGDIFGSSNNSYAGAIVAAGASSPADVYTSFLYEDSTLHYVHIASMQLRRVPRTYLAAGGIPTPAVVTTLADVTLSADTPVGWENDGNRPGRYVGTLPGMPLIDPDYAYAVFGTAELRLLADDSVVDGPTSVILSVLDPAVDSLDGAAPVDITMSFTGSDPGAAEVSGYYFVTEGYIDPPAAELEVTFRLVVNYTETTDIVVCTDVPELNIVAGAYTGEVINVEAICS